MPSTLGELRTKVSRYGELLTVLGMLEVMMVAYGVLVKVSAPLEQCEYLADPGWQLCNDANCRSRVRGGEEPIVCLGYMRRPRIDLLGVHRKVHRRPGSIAIV